LRLSKSIYHESRPVICHLAHQLDPGGTEKLVYKMALALREKYEVLVCTLEKPGVFGAALRRAGIPVYPLFREPGIDFNVIFSLKRIFQRHQVALVHAHQYSPFFYAILTKFIYPHLKVLFQEHGRHYPEIDKPLRKLINRFFFQPFTGAIVSVSQEVKERLVRYEGLKAERIRVIYNGIEDVCRLSASERNELRSSWGFHPEEVVVATVGRFDPIKNLPLLLLALALARQKVPKLRGLLIGDGPEMERLKTLTRKLGLEKTVVFTGFRKDAVRLLQMADIFALSSLSEGTSLALLEAMACGLPVVATAVGGNPEIVEDGKTGLLVPSEDPPALAGALWLLAENPSLREKLGQRGREKFEKKFLFSQMLSAYEKLYQELVFCPEKEGKLCAVW